MGCTEWLRAQFGRPTGLWGTVAGFIMANRQLDRNHSTQRIARTTVAAAMLKSIRKTE